MLLFGVHLKELEVEWRGKWSHQAPGLQKHILKETKVLLARRDSDAKGAAHSGIARIAASRAKDDIADPEFAQQKVFAHSICFLSGVSRKPVSVNHIRGSRCPEARQSIPFSPLTIGRKVFAIYLITDTGDRVKTG